MIAHINSRPNNLPIEVFAIFYAHYRLTYWVNKRESNERTETSAEIEYLNFISNLADCDYPMSSRVNESVCDVIVWENI